MRLKNHIQRLHNSTERDYLARMIDDKVEAMEKAREFAFDYWDGSRRYGYGGYRYIPGRWAPLARNLIDEYGLTSTSKVLDVGAGKGFLLYELQLLLPGISLFALDISKYALENLHPSLVAQTQQSDCRNLNFRDNQFDLVVSINTLHNLELSDCLESLTEIERVARNSYVVVESFRNNQEFFNLQCWALTAKLLLSTDDWLKVFELAGFTGDYEWIFFE